MHECLDAQEDALRAGISSASPEFGVVPPAQWGRLFAGGAGGAPVPAERGAWAGFYPAMAAAVRGAGAVPVAPAEALAVMRVLEAARESAASGVIVDLPVV